MKKTIIIAVILLLGCLSLNAQKAPGKENKFYCNVEIYETASLDLPKGLNKKVLYDTGLNFAMGYEFNRFLTLAGGIGCNTIDMGTKNMKHFFPVFLRIHSEFLDSKVTPYADLDLGWNFVCRKLYCELLGYDEKLENSHILEEGYLVNGVDPFDEDLEQYLFEDKTNVYLDIVPGRMQYMPEGMFAKLALGASIKAGEHKVNIGIVGSLTQFFWGFRTLGKTTEKLNEYAQHVDVRPEEDKDFYDPNNPDKYMYMKTGRDPFFSRFKPGVSIKVGFTF